MKILKLAGMIPALAFMVSLGVSSDAQASSLMFDRGLPTDNLNNSSGGDRSNVSWLSSPTGDGFVGDDFSIGSAGTTYVIDSLTVWGAQIAPLGDEIDDISLWIGKQGQQLSEVSSGTLTAGTNTNSNSNISHNFVTYADGSDYQTASGGFVSIAETVFSGLNLTVEGGVLYDFGIAANGPIGWFGHASNAALSGSTQDGADGLYREFDSAGNFIGAVDSNGNGWDKSSDINVQVTAAPIPLPAAGWLLLTAFGGLGIAARRRKAA